MNIEQLHDALRVANMALAQVRKEFGDADKAARNAVREQFNEAILMAMENANAAKRAHDDALVSAALASPLVGKRVFRERRRATSWMDSPKPEAHGVIEVWRAGAPSSKSSNPDPGDLIVRHMKKDGKPSKMYDRFPWKAHTLPSGWVIVEGEK